MGEGVIRGFVLFLSFVYFVRKEDERRLLQYDLPGKYPSLGHHPGTLTCTMRHIRAGHATIFFFFAKTRQHGRASVTKNLKKC